MSPTNRHKYKYFHSTVQQAKDRGQKFYFCRLPFDVRPRNVKLNREIKFDVTWSYVKRQTAKMTSEFVFFSSNPSLNHIKIEKCLLLIATNINIFTLLFNELKTDGKSFIFAVCRLTYDRVTSNLTSLVLTNQITAHRFQIAAHDGRRCGIDKWHERELQRSQV